MNDISPYCRKSRAAGRCRWLFTLLFGGVMALCLGACSTPDSAPVDEAPADVRERGSDSALDSRGEGDTRVVPPEVVAPPVDPVPPVEGELLIEEFYYSGSPPGGGADHYFSDQFIELVNAADHPLDLSGVLVADVFGSAGAINPGMQPDSYRQTQPERVVMDSVWRIPDGFQLAPQERLIIAHDGTNHRPFSTIDLSGANLEAFVAQSGKDEDNPTVANLESVVFNGGYDWLMTVFGPSAVLLAADTTLGTIPGPFGPLPTAPASAVLDAVEAVMDANSGDFKRLPDSVDSGFAWVSGTYVGESLHRRRAGEGWQDTNDSGADFEAGPPQPGQPIASAGITGDPWIELGTGQYLFGSLSEGDDIELVAGPQGGWHVDVSLRFGGFGPSGIVLSYEAVHENGEAISFVTQAVLSSKSVLADGEGWQRVGDRIVLDIAAPAEVVGSSVVLHVNATLSEQSWVDQRTVRVVDNE